MRLFIAVNFDRSTKDKLAAIRDRFRLAGARGNFTHEENLHLTLVFLGELGEKDVPVIVRSMEQRFHAPVELVFSSIGFFKNRSGKMLWVGIAGNPALEDLYNGLCDDMQAAGFSIERDRAFTPHVTLCREMALKDRQDTAIESFSMKAERISLMRSDRINGNLVYTELKAVARPELKAVARPELNAVARPETFDVTRTAD